MKIIQKICNFIVRNSNIKVIQGPPGPMGMMGVGVQSIDTITVIKKDEKIKHVILRDEYGNKICNNIKVIDL